MIKKIKNELFYAMILDIENMQQTPALAFFLKDKIDTFYNRNRKQILFLKAQVQLLAEKYVEKDEAGKLKIIEVEGKKAYAHETPDMNDKHQAAMDELMNKEYEFKF